MHLMNYTRTPILVYMYTINTIIVINVTSQIPAVYMHISFATANNHFEDVILVIYTMLTS